jgi:hypothetical protein
LCVWGDEKGSKNSRGAVWAAAIWPKLAGLATLREIQQARSADPLVREKAISALEANSQGLYGPGREVVFIGSSSIRLWDTLIDRSDALLGSHGEPGGDNYSFGGPRLSNHARWDC